MQRRACTSDQLLSCAGTVGAVPRSEPCKVLQPATGRDRLEQSDARDHANCSSRCRPLQRLVSCACRRGTGTSSAAYVHGPPSCAVLPGPIPSEPSRPAGTSTANEYGRPGPYVGHALTSFGHGGINVSPTNRPVASNQAIDNAITVFFIQNLSTEGEAKTN